MNDKSLLKKDITLLVNSCDKYCDVWDGFFTLLKIQWANCPLDIILNTETKQYNFSGFNIKTVNTQKNIPWGKRLLKVLKQIKTKYILFFLEDFYLEGKVDEDELFKCYKYMEDNPNIACFSFMPVEDKNNTTSDKYLGFEKRPQNGQYRLNCQVALWNREYLISYIRPHESPWEWEIYGSRRSKRYKEEFYSIIESEKDVFYYNKGWIIYRGHWCKSAVLPLAKHYELKIDFTKRGFWEDVKSSNIKRKRNLWHGIKNRINKIKSLI